MTINFTLPDSLLTVYGGVERRSKPRIYEPFPVTVHGMDASGEEFRAAGLLDNLSAAGLYLRLLQRVEPGTTLSVIIRFSNGQNGAAAPRVATQGVVLRAELKPGGACGLGIKITRHWFL
jgi:hypothetical protein